MAYKYCTVAQLAYGFSKNRHPVLLCRPARVRHFQNVYNIAFLFQLFLRRRVPVCLRRAKPAVDNENSWHLRYYCVCYLIRRHFACIYYHVSVLFLTERIKAVDFFPVASLIIVFLNEFFSRFLQADVSPLRVSFCPYMRRRSKPYTAIV